MSETARPFLSDEEIASICDGVRLPGWQCRHLDSLKIHYLKKPNGRPIVARSEFERVAGAARFGKAQNDEPARTGPNVEAMNDYIARKRNGTTTQRR